jgi:hypothetical protein
VGIESTDELLHDEWQQRMDKQELLLRLLAEITGHSDRIDVLLEQRALEHDPDRMA